MVSGSIADASEGNDDSAVTSPLLNFRDFGSRPTATGYHVVSGRLYRSGHHAGVSEGSRARLMALNFGLVVDLRYPGERAQDAAPWPITWRDRVLAHDVDSGANAPHVTLLSAAERGPNAVHHAYEEFYRTLPFDPVYRPLFVAAFSRLAAVDGPVLVHCSAGKDRTGMFVAFLLDVLGVPRQAINDDYMLSADEPAFRRIKLDVAARMTADGIERPDAVAAELAGVSPDYLAASFAVIDERYGSVETYLMASGLASRDLAHIRQRFLDGKLPRGSAVVSRHINIGGDRQ